ncbi:MAG: DoxX family protein [Acidiferrobacterales bacterium]|jgi:putative oxidoreductase
MDKLNPYFSLAGRILIALTFVFSGVSKIGAYEATQGYMSAMGVPATLLLPTIIFEIGAGLAIIVGFQTRITALLLAAFSLLRAMLFHNQLGDQTQFIMSMKNVAIAGGLLFLARHGASERSLDQRRAQAAI